MDEIDAIIVSSSWANHIHIAIDGMKAGKYVGVEVGGAIPWMNAGNLSEHMKRPALHACCWKTAVTAGKNL